MTTEQLISELSDKYGEWFETYQEQAPDLMIRLLASLLIREREENYCLKRRLDRVYTSSAK